MWLFYYIGIALYVCGVRVAALFSEKARAWIKGREGLLKSLEGKIPSDRKVVWMHCASLGEFEMGRPVLEAIRNDFPDKFLVLTFFSPSGYEIRKNYPGADLVIYLPADLPGNARQFIKLLKPCLAVFVKYEFWFGYLRELHKNKVPTLLISGRFRPGQHFFRWYGKWFYNKLFYFNHLHLQDQESADAAGPNFKSRISVSGDTRYDRVSANALLKKDLPEISAWLNGRSCLIAGSTWPADDVLMLPWEKSEWALIIAPHEVNPARIKALKTMAGEQALLYSELPAQSGNILIIDNIGMLLSIYALGRTAYVGGAFGTALHNILEPAAFGLPVLFGPNHQKFPEAAAIEKAGAGKSISNRKEFEESLANFMQAQHHEKASQNAIQFVKERTGATARIMKTIHNLMS